MVRDTLMSNKDGAHFGVTLNAEMAAQFLFVTHLDGFHGAFCTNQFFCHFLWIA